jgi:hypothetical protein
LKNGLLSLSGGANFVNRRLKRSNQKSFGQFESDSLAMNIEKQSSLTRLQAFLSIGVKVRVWTE